MTSTPTTRPTEAICPPWCTGHLDGYQDWALDLETDRMTRFHAEVGIIIGDIAVTVVQTEVAPNLDSPGGLLTPRVDISENRQGLHELTEGEAHELGLAIVRAADRLRRFRQEQAR